MWASALRWAGSWRARRRCRAASSPGSSILRTNSVPAILPFHSEGHIIRSIGFPVPCFGSLTFLLASFVAGVLANAVNHISNRQSLVAKRLSIKRIRSGARRNQAGQFLETLRQVAVVLKPIALDGQGGLRQAQACHYLRLLDHGFSRGREEHARKKQEFVISQFFVNSLAELFGLIQSLRKRSFRRVQRLIHDFQIEQEVAVSQAREVPHPGDEPE